MQNIQPVTIQDLRIQKRNQKFVSSIIYHVGVGLVGLIMLYPVMWLFASSLKPADEIWTNVNSLIPSQIDIGNYFDGWKGFGGITFGTFFKNSFIYAGFATLFAVSASTVVAYGFARVQFRGKRIWFTVMLLTLMLPSQVLIIPQYIIFLRLDWLNTFLPLLVPRLGGDVFFIFMIISSFVGFRWISTKPP